MRTCAAARNRCTGSIPGEKGFLKRAAATRVPYADVQPLYNFVTGERVPLELPAPFEGILARSPLALVACQVRYSDSARVLSGGVAAELSRRLADAKFPYPRVDQVQLQNFNVDVGAGTARSESAGRGWRLQTEDGRWILTVTPDAVTLETTRYKTWREDFCARFCAVVDALCEAVSPKAETRLGLRYVDVIVDPPAKHMADWKGWIDQSFLGPIAHPRLGSGISTMQQQMSLNLDHDIRATLRSGVYPDAARDNTPTYLIDTDVFRESLVQFERDGIYEMIERLHDWNLRLFQMIITPAMLAHLRGAETIAS